jgi:DedD protein
MISLSSFFKKKSPEPTQAKIEPGFRPRQSKVELENEDVLTENPEVQRARHRLIGAGLLLLIAVIGLPKLFDAQPKKINNDVVIKVVQSVTNNPNNIDTPLEEEKVISKNAIDTNPQTNTAKPSLIDPANEKVLSLKKSVEDKPDSNSAVPVQEKSKASTDSNESLKSVPKKGSIQTDPGEVIVNSQSPAPKLDNKSAKFILRVATLSNYDRVKEVIAKIKELNIPTKVSEKKREAPDSGVMYFIQAGPFASKEEAVSADKKISALVGLKLSPTIVEINK